MFSFSSDEIFRLLLQDMEPIIPFSSLIIIEPMISPAGPQHLKNLRSILVKGAYERRDVWPDSAQAAEALKMRARTKKWDPRILDLFVVRLSWFGMMICRLENNNRNMPSYHTRARLLLTRHITVLPLPVLAIRKRYVTDR